MQSNTVVLLNKIGAELRDNKYEKQDDVDAREQVAQMLSNAHTH